MSPTLLLRSNRMRGVLRRHQPRIRTPFLLPPSSRSHYPAGCINASSDMSTSSALQALNGAQMRACACMRVRACAGGGPLRIFMRGLPCETPSRSSFSFRRLAPSRPPPAPPTPRSSLILSLHHRLFSRFFLVLSDLEE